MWRKSSPQRSLRRDADGFHQCDDVQGPLTVGSQLIVAGDVVQAPDDTQQLRPTVDQGIANVGVPNVVMADSGYFCAVHNLGRLLRTGADAVRWMPSPLSVRLAMISPAPSSTSVSGA